MEFISNTLMTIAVIIGIAAFFYSFYVLFQRFILHKKVSFKKVGIAWGAYFGMCIIAALVLPKPDNSSQSSKISETKTSKKDDTKEVADDSNANDDNAQSDNNETNTNDDEKNLDAKKINKDITSLLNDDKKDASNGDERYSYANFIQKIKYQEDNTDVYVNDNFISLSNESKNTIAEKIQGVVGAAVSMSDEDYQPKDDQEGYHLGFWYGKRAVGHSKMNFHKYKWCNLD